MSRRRIHSLLPVLVLVTGGAWCDAARAGLRDLPDLPARDAGSLKDYAQTLPAHVAPNSYSKTAPEPLPKPEPAPPHLQAIQRQYDAPESGTGDAIPAIEGPALGSLALRAVMWLGVICAAIILLSLLLRKAGRRTPLLAGQQFGSILGRLYLTPKAALHFVHSGDRVLVIGVTPNAIALVTEFDAESFLAAPDRATAAAAAPHSFLSRLQASLEQTEPDSASGDDEIAALRSDIERLREHLQERARETRA